MSVLKTLKLFRLNIGGTKSRKRDATTAEDTAVSNNTDEDLRIASRIIDMRLPLMPRIESVSQAKPQSSTIRSTSFLTNASKFDKTACKHSDATDTCADCSTPCLLQVSASRRDEILPKLPVVRMVSSESMRGDTASPANTQFQESRTWTDFQHEPRRFPVVYDEKPHSSRLQRSSSTGQLGRSTTDGQRLLIRENSATDALTPTPGMRPSLEMHHRRDRAWAHEGKCSPSEHTRVQDRQKSRLSKSNSFGQMSMPPAKHPPAGAFGHPRAPSQKERWGGQSQSTRRPQDALLQQCHSLYQERTPLRSRQADVNQEHMVDPLSVNSPARPSRRRMQNLSRAVNATTSRCVRHTNSIGENSANRQSRMRQRRVSFRFEPIVHTTFHGDVYCRKPVPNTSVRIPMMEIYRGLMEYKLIEMRVHESSLYLTNKHLSKAKGNDRERMVRVLHNILNRHKAILNAPDAQRAN